MVKTEYYKDLTKMNTFGMKVKARCFIEYDSVADLVDIEFEELARPVLHIGGGSNLLFTDDFKGTVLHSKIDFIEILDECHSAPVAPSQTSLGPSPYPGVGKCHFRTNDTSSEEVQPVETVLVSVGAGVVFDDFCDWAAKEGLWGVENLSHIPGKVGASAVQNIGAYGVEVKDVIRKVYCYDTVDEEFVNFDVEDLQYGYRDSAFKDPEIRGRYIVTHVVFALSRTPQPKLEYGHLKEAVEAAGSELTPGLIRKVIIKIRKEKLPEPSVMGSAGSFFKNPVISREHFDRIEAAAKAEHGADCKVPHYDLPDGMVKVPAAWMIEQCGWKGRRSGGAAVWEKQPLVIVNYTGEAYPEEIIGLEKRIIASVKTKFGVELHPEVDHI
jgi:UDP-N-acetylmuramate dehydrogenase